MDHLSRSYGIFLLQYIFDQNTTHHIHIGARLGHTLRAAVLDRLAIDCLLILVVVLDIIRVVHARLVLRLGDADEAVGALERRWLGFYHLNVGVLDSGRPDWRRVRCREPEASLRGRGRLAGGRNYGAFGEAECAVLVGVPVVVVTVVVVGVPVVVVAVGPVVVVVAVAPVVVVPVVAAVEAGQTIVVIAVVVEAVAQVPVVVEEGSE